MRTQASSGTLALMSAVEATRALPAELSKAGLAAWKALLRAYSRLMPELDEELRRRHGYGIGDLDVLAQLDDAPEGGLRMCDLAAAVVLSPSGLSRRVDRLEQAGFTLRERAEHDARNVVARLTPAGRKLLRRLQATHRAGVNRRFAERFSDEELGMLAELLARVGGES